MCGRFALSQRASVYADWFGAGLVLTEELEANYNVAPTDPVYAVADHEGERQLGSFRWGLIPWFAKDRKIGARHINARVETVATKPSFKDSFISKRCIVPADGFYEWKPMAKGKLPHYIHSPDDGPLAINYNGMRDGHSSVISTCRTPSSNDHGATHVDCSEQ